MRCISSLLALDFRFPTSDRRQRLFFLPEVTLLCVLVIAVKLLFPIEETASFARSMTDVTALQIDWRTWVEAFNDHKERMQSEDHIEKGSEMQMTEKDVLTMSNQQLDDYMDWFEEMWVDEDRVQQKQRPLPKELLDMFPPRDYARATPSTKYDFSKRREMNTQSTEKFLIEVISTIGIRPTQDNSRESSNLTGDRYVRYQNADDLPPYARVFHQAVADAVAFKIETLILAVLQVEQQLIEWRRSRGPADQRRRGSHEGDDADMSDDAGNMEREIDGPTNARASADTDSLNEDEMEDSMSASP